MTFLQTHQNTFISYSQNANKNKLFLLINLVKTEKEKKTSQIKSILS